MADISANYVSGNFIDVGAFGITNVPGTWVSGTFLTNLGVETTVQSAFNIIQTTFTGGQQLDIGSFGGSSLPGQFAGSTFTEIYSYIPNVLPLTVGTGEQPVSSTRYWLS